jgi:hypothetical protein
VIVLRSLREGKGHAIRVLHLGETGIRWVRVLRRARKQRSGGRETHIALQNGRPLSRPTDAAPAQPVHDPDLDVTERSPHGAGTR